VDNNKDDDGDQSIVALLGRAEEMNDGTFRSAVIYSDEAPILVSFCRVGCKLGWPDFPR
jgi:hypothetical protein